jgi:hypothetical protein
MEKTESVLKLEGKGFRRLVGVKKGTYKKMLKVVKRGNKKKRERGGRKSKIGVEEMLLMTLEYWRKYRTYFEIGIEYGVSESCAYKKIRLVEDELTKSEEFRLGGKKELIGKKEEAVIIDVTESPIERPKKNRRCIIRERKRDIV